MGRKPENAENPFEVNQNRLTFVACPQVADRVSVEFGRFPSF
jgi:hypothetical protein